MLRIVQQQHAGAAKGYYRSGYYAEGGDARGVWGGDAAGRLGLGVGGEVGWPDLDALVENWRPGGAGGRWTPANVANRRVGYDVSWSAPKSVSVLYEWTLDPDILRAFHAAVDAAMGALERDARTRVRRAEDRAHADGSRVTANLVWAKFVHRTTRPVGGVPDPQLHAHCFVFNGTFDHEERRWKAVDLSEAKRQGRFLEAVFHSHLAGGLRELGYRVDKRPGGRWEVAGVPADVIRRFSRRTELIEKVAMERGVVDPAARDKLGASTREGKARTPLSPEQLRALWAERLSAADIDALARVQTDRTAPPAAPTRTLAIKAVAFALEHCLERRSVVPERTLLAEALRWGVGWVRVEDVSAVLRALEAKGAVVVRDHPDLPGQRGVTTAAVLDEERQLLLLARDGKGRCPPLAPGAALADGLSAEQRRAVEHILGTRDRVVLVRGAAGVGKTTLLKEVARHVPGLTVLAPSAAASRGALRAAGFADADTVARFLADDAFRSRAHGGVVVVDEAGLVGTPTLVRLLRVTDALGARVVLVGDRRQHASVERGTALRQLETQVGLYPATVTRIQRQRGEYRAAVAALSRGDVGRGFRALDALGWVAELPDMLDRARAAADAYHRLRRAGRSVLVVAPTHAEGALVTAAIRAEAGLPAGVPVLRLESKGLTLAERKIAPSYEAGDMVEFHRARWGRKRYAVREAGAGRVVLDNGRDLFLPGADAFEVYRPADLSLAAGDLVRVTKNGRSLCGAHRVNNGEVYTVAAVDPGRGTATLSNGWRIPLDFGHLAHGYVSTSFGAQGRAADVVVLFQGVPSRGAASPEQFYVSASRGREQCLVFTDSKAALLAAVSTAEPRPTATDLVRPAARRGRARGREVCESNPELWPSQPSSTPGRTATRRSA